MAALANVFLYAPQDFRNLCVLSRTLEVFGHSNCYVFDSRRLIRERYGKSRARVMRDVSSGAFSRMQWQQVEDAEAFLAEYPGRIVATVANGNATALTRFQFLPDDLLVFGSESQGLPDAIVGAAQTSVTIPSRGETQSLNLAVSLAVILFEAQRQLDPST